MKVAIQGELGSFSHEAAERMLPRCTVVPCSRSAEVFDRVQREIGGRGSHPNRKHAGRNRGGARGSDADARGLHSSRVSVADRAQRDCYAGRAARGFAEGVVASGGARPVPGFFPATSENRGGAVLRHGRQREACDRQPIKRRCRNRRKAGRTGILWEHSSIQR